MPCIDRYIYFYFEEMGIELPIVNRERMCRQGCCTICTGKIVNEISSGIRGKVKQDAPLGLLKDFREKGRFINCNYCNIIYIILIYIYTFMLISYVGSLKDYVFMYMFCLF